MGAGIQDLATRALMADESEALAFDKLRSIRRLVLLTLAFEAWLALLYQPYSRAPLVNKGSGPS